MSARRQRLVQAHTAKAEERDVEPVGGLVLEGRDQRGFVGRELVEKKLCAARVDDAESFVACVHVHDDIWIWKVAKVRE